MAKTKDFARYLEKKLEADPQLRAAVEREQFNGRIAQVIYDAREAAGLTQAELATRAGTRQSVIARLEDADYRGHSLSMLWRIAQALDREVLVELRPRKGGAGKGRSGRKKAS